MPLVRFKIRNELSLGGPELNRSAAVDDEEPKTILGAVEVAGLIGILRQLGDLAEFSAEVFNGIQEEVTVTASRCQKLTSRVRRIESALSPLEKAVLSQTSHIHFAYTAGTEWHPRIRNGHSHFVQSDLPLCVMESYEQCTDPPPLHLLDRFAVGGPGSCLRKYSDPTFFRKELSNPNKADDIKVQKDQAHRKRKKKRLPQRNICRSNAVSTSDETNGAHLSSLTDERQTTSQSTSTVDMPRSSNMQELSDIVDQSHLQGQSDAQEQREAQVQSDFQEAAKTRDSITGSGYIEYVINHSPVNKPEVKLAEGLQPADRIASDVPDGCIEVVDDNIIYSPSEDLRVPCASIVCDEKKETLESMVEKSSKEEEVSEINESKFGPGTPDRVRQNQWDFERTYILFDEVDIVGEKQSKTQANNIDGTLGIENEGEDKSEQESEADEFLDARNTIDSESESDFDGTPKPKLEHYFGDISTYCSEDANSDNNDGSEDIPYEQMADDPPHENSLDESCSGSCLPEDANVSCCLSDPVSGKTLSHDESSQKPRDFFAMYPSLLAEEAFPDVTNLQEKPAGAHPLLAGDCVNKKIPSEEPILSCPSMKDAIPVEKILQEGHLTNDQSPAEAMPLEKISPGESVAKYPSFAEIVPQEKILPEKSLPKLSSWEEAVPENMTVAGGPDAAHLTFPKAVQDEKISPEVLDSKNLSVPEAASPEHITLEKFVGIYPCLAEAVPDESFLTEEPEVMPIEKLLPEKPLDAYQYVEELPEEKILQEKYVDSAHPSFAEAAPESNLSSEVLDSTNVSEAVPQEQIPVEESVDINPRLVEAVPEERFLPEELLETYPSLAQLSEEEISHEETDETTHPSQAICDEDILSEVSDSTNLSVEEAIPEEQTLLEEFVGINPCLVEAVPDERLLPEEPVTTCLSLTKAATIETTFSAKPLETYPSLPEEAVDAASISEAISDEQISPKVLDSTNSPVAEIVPQEQISIEEFFGIDPCFPEAVPDKRVLPDVPVTSCFYLTKVVPIEEVMPEEPIEACPSLGKLPKDIQPSCAKAESDENVSPEVLDSTNSFAAEAIPHEQIALEEFVGIDPCLEEAGVDERDLPEEFDTACLSLTKATAIETTFPEKPWVPSLEELTEEKISQQEEHGDVTHLFSEAVGDETISPLEDPSSTCLSLEESAMHEKTSHKELVGTNPFLELDVPEERWFTGKPGVTYQSLGEAISKEKNLPEEPLPTYPSLAEAVPDAKISLEEPDTTCSPSAEAVSDEKISGSEAPGSTTETGPHNKTFPEEPFAMNISLAEGGFDEKISGSEAPGSTAETCPHNKTFHEELIATDKSLTEVVFDEKISDSETPGSTAETCPHNKTFHEEPIAIDTSSAEVVFDDEISDSEAPGSTAETCPHSKTFHEEPIAIDTSSTEVVFDDKISDSEAPGSTAETCPHSKTFHEEPIATDLSSMEAVFDEKTPASEPSGSTTETGSHYNTFPEAPVPEDIILPKEPAATYLALAEGIPDQKVFLDDAALLLFAEAIFDQKFSPEVPDSTHPSFKEPEMPLAPPSLVTDLPAKNILVKEGDANDESYTASDISMNQKSGFLEPESADRTVPLSGGTVTISPHTQESSSDGTSVEPVSIWSNGGLFGLAPLKPPVFAGPNSVSKHIQNENNEASVLSTRKQESSSRSVNDTEKSSLPLAVSNPTSQQINLLSHSNGSHSLLQSTATSFKVFGLSHRLLMSGFRGNSSSTSKFESLPTASYDTRVGAIEDKSQQTPGGSSFEEQLDYESSLFGSPTSSPPIEHMKISFNTKDASPVSKLKLRIPCQPQNRENADMFPSFQLVPEASNSDDDSDTFCQSSPCVSDNCLSDSELWESDESPRKSVSSSKQVGETSRHGEMGSFSSSFLDLPCYDSVDHQSTSSRVEQEEDKEEVPEYIPSVSEIIRDWPLNKPKNSPSSNEANADASVVLKKRKINISDDDGER